MLRQTVHGSEPFPALVDRLVREAFLPAGAGNDALQFAGYLLYQFPVPLILAAAIAGLLRLGRERRADLTGLLLLYATNALFAFSYQVPDRFAFYLPSYLVLALLAAPGLDRLLVLARPRAAAVALAGLVCVVTPPIVYRMAPALIESGRLSRFPSPRPIPGRDPLLFHLYPGKNGDDGALRFSVEALAPLPQGALLLADYTLNTPLNYMQVVAGLRPDVEVYYASLRRQLPIALAATRRSRRVYIAARDSFYDVAGLSTRFDIRASGPIFELVPQVQPASERHRRRAATGTSGERTPGGAVANP